MFSSTLLHSRVNDQILTVQILTVHRRHFFFTQALQMSAVKLAYALILAAICLGYQQPNVELDDRQSIEDLSF